MKFSAVRPRTILPDESRTVVTTCWSCTLTRNVGSWIARMSPSNMMSTFMSVSLRDIACLVLAQTKRLVVCARFETPDVAVRRLARHELQRVDTSDSQFLMEVAIKQ